MNTTTPRFCDPLSLAVLAASTSLEPFRLNGDEPGYVGLWLGDCHVNCYGLDVAVKTHEGHDRALLHVDLNLGGWSACAYADTPADDNELVNA